MRNDLSILGFFPIGVLAYKECNEIQNGTTQSGQLRGEQLKMRPSQCWDNSAEEIFCQKF